MGPGKTRIVNLVHGETSYISHFLKRVPDSDGDGPTDVV